MRKSEYKTRSQRQLRVAEEVRHALVSIIQRGELRDPDLAGVSITVSEVRISSDLKNATAFVSRLGGGEEDALVKAMERAAAFIRQRIGQELTLKFVPAIYFQADQSFDYADRIGEVLRSTTLQAESVNKA